MKEFIQKWILPVILLLAVAVFFFGFRPKGLNSFIHTQKKKQIDAKKTKLQTKIETIDLKIIEEKKKIGDNDKKIEKLEQDKQKFNEKVDDAKNNLDALDDMFTQLL